MTVTETLQVDNDRLRQLDELTSGSFNPCYQCGVCTAICPWGLVRSDGMPVRRLVRSAQLGLPVGRVDNYLWLCSMCKLCEEACPRDVRIIDTIRALRSAAFQERRIPQKLEAALWSVYENGNPWSGRKKERGKWAEGLSLKDAQKGVKVLLYVGCAASFDRRLQKVAKAVASILQAAKVDFGILGAEETCCGDVVRNIGESEFLRELVEGNIQSFNKTGAETVIAISPHCSNMFKNVYPRFGAKFAAEHYAEYIHRLLDDDKIRPVQTLSASVTYHDPCYLGRYDGVYEAPRKILESIPGVKLVEMSDNKENALCCGGGGGRMWLETEAHERFSNLRVDQAAQTGAELLATSCPYCIQNFEDSVRTKRLEAMKIHDISELMLQSIKH